jgi:hypothetical protein
MCDVTHSVEAQLFALESEAAEETVGEARADAETRDREPPFVRERVGAGRSMAWSAVAARGTRWREDRV